MDRHGNINAQEGVDRCACGSKYWENDRCIDCGELVEIAQLQASTPNHMLLAKQVLAWRMDALRVYAGLAEVIDWPDVPLSKFEPVPPRPEGSRIVIENGFAYLIRDKEIASV